MTRRSDRDAARLIRSRALGLAIVDTALFIAFIALCAFGWSVTP